MAFSLCDTGGALAQMACHPVSARLRLGSEVHDPQSQRTPGNYFGALSHHGGFPARSGVDIERCHGVLSI